MPSRHVYEIYIRTTPERLWQALCDPELTPRYFFGTRFDGELAAGTTYAYRVADGGVAVDGAIEEAEPYRRLTMTFHVAFDADAAAESPSRVTWEITPLGDVCRLSMVHRDLYGAPHTAAITATGWPVLLSSLKSLLETGDGLGEVPDDRAAEPPTPDEIDRTLHREQGIATNQATWALLERTDRTPDDDLRMIHTAHASAYHWSLAGEADHRAQGEWLCSHVYAVLGRGEPALHHARTCLDITQSADLRDFNLAYAHEAMARALALDGRLDEAATYLASARAVTIANDEDRAILEADLAAEPWYGLSI